MPLSTLDLVDALHRTSYRRAPTPISPLPLTEVVGRAVERGGQSHKILGARASRGPCGATEREKKMKKRKKEEKERKKGKKKEKKLKVIKKTKKRKTKNKKYRKGPKLKQNNSY